MSIASPYRPAPSPADRARALRHTRPALEMCQWENIEYDLEDMEEFVQTYEWADLTDFLGEADEDYAHELQLAVSMLGEKIERYRERLDWETGEKFNLVMSCIPGLPLTGYDSLEEDYFPLSDYEQDMAREKARKKLLEPTKSAGHDLIFNNMSLFLDFLAIREEYQNLKLIFDVAADTEAGIRGLMDGIDAAWTECEKDGWYDWKPAVRKFDRLADSVPERMWVE